MNWTASITYKQERKKERKSLKPYNCGNTFVRRHEDSPLVVQHKPSRRFRQRKLLIRWLLRFWLPHLHSTTSVNFKIIFYYILPFSTGFLLLLRSWRSSTALLLCWCVATQQPTSSACVYTAVFKLGIMNERRWDFWRNFNNIGRDCWTRWICGHRETHLLFADCWNGGENRILLSIRAP